MKPKEPPVTIKRIEEFSEEDRARWNNIKPARNQDGTLIKPPAKDPVTQRRIFGK